MSLFEKPAKVTVVLVLVVVAFIWAAGNISNLPQRREASAVDSIYESTHDAVSSKTDDLSSKTDAPAPPSETGKGVLSTLIKMSGGRDRI